MSTVFLSHSGSDRAITEKVVAALRERGVEALFVDFDPEHGIPAGRRWERELYAQLRRADAVVAILSENAVASSWCFAEISLARSLGRPVLPLRTEPKADLSLLCDVQWTDIAEDEWADRLVEGLRDAGVDRGIAYTWNAGRSPYPGLAPFTAEDAAVFFGRDEEVHRLVELVHPTLRRGNGAIVALAGPSGSGKSSLVHAGLVPRLRHERGRWIVLPTVIPGRTPVRELARGLAAALGRGTDDVLRVLAESPRRVAGLVDHLVEDPDAPRDRRRPDVLLVVDQAEELITRAPSDEQMRFLELLREMRNAEPTVWVVMTLRPEFLSPTSERAGLVEVVDETMMIEPVRRDRLAEVIARPARRGGLEFDDGLVERMVGDTAGGDALPLLAHTLRELADRAGPDGFIAHEEYVAVGGVLGALEHRADRVAGELAREGHSGVVVPTLLRFVHLRGNDEATGRSVSPAELGVDERLVVDAFVEARLLTADRAESEPVTVRVAHEALLRRWTPLRTAIEADREALRLQAEVERLAGEWERSSRDESYLLGGARLAAVEQWVAKRAGGIGPAEHAFVEASRLRHTHELDLAQRSNRRLRRLVGGLAALLVLTLLAGALVVVQTLQAETQSRLASSRLFAARAESVVRTEPDTAILDGLQSMSLARGQHAQAPAGLVDAMSQVTHTSRTVLAHRGSASAVAFSPDGRLFATVGGDYEVRLWDAASGAPHGLPLAGHTNTIFSVAFSPDGSLLATASVDKTIRLWDVRTGTPHGAPLLGHIAQAVDVEFSPDGQLLASASADHTVRLWDVATGLQHGQPLVGNGSFVLSVAFSPDGTTLASAGSDRTVRLWDVATGAQRGAPLVGHTDQVWDVAFSHDGRVLASAGADDTVRLWDPATGRSAGPTLTGSGGGALLSEAFSPDDRMLAVGGGDTNVSTWDTATWTLQSVFKGHTSEVNGVAFSPDGRTLASASEDRTVRLWDVAEHPSVSRALLGHTDSVSAVAFESSGHLLATASWDTTVRLWDVRTGRPAGAPLVGHTGHVDAVKFSPDDRLLATGGDDGTVRLWDVSTGQPHGPPLTGTSSFNAVAFSPDGRLLAAAGTGDTVLLWDVATGQRHGAPLSGHVATVDDLAFSPDGRLLASGSLDRTLRLWNVALGAPAGDPFTQYSGAVTSVAFSPDGRTLASGTGDGSVVTWDVLTRKAHGPPFNGHRSGVTAVAFSPDGATLASAGLDTTILLSDATTAVPRGPVLDAHTNVAYDVAFSPDGREIASSGADDVVRLWNLQFSDWLPDGCALVDRNLSINEWSQVAPDLPYERTCPSLPSGDGAPGDAPAADYG